MSLRASTGQSSRLTSRRSPAVSSRKSKRSKRLLWTIIKILVIFLVGILSLFASKREKSWLLSSTSFQPFENHNEEAVTTNIPQGSSNSSSHGLEPAEDTASPRRPTRTRASSEDEENKAIAQKTAEKQSTTNEGSGHSKVQYTADPPQVDHYIGRLYECGWFAFNHSPHFRLWFPQHKPTQLRLVNETVQPQTNKTLRIFQYNFTSKDVIINSGDDFWPACHRDPKPFPTYQAYHEWLRDEYPGKVLMINREYYEIWTGGYWDRLYQMGAPYETGNIFAWENSTGGTTEADRRIKLTYLQKTLVTMGPDAWHKIFDPTLRPRSTRERFLVYAQHHCVDYREKAFLRIAHAVGNGLNSDEAPVLEFTVCNGTTYADYEAPDEENLPSNVVRQSAAIPNHILNEDWEDNANMMGRYRFCLCMENHAAVYGYITEKILNAFLSGCIPIYYGTDKIFDIFNDKSFVFYNVTNETASAAAVAQIVELERNISAYNAMLSEPILKNGLETIEEYFSLAATIGNATLMKRIHRMMGFAPFVQRDPSSNSRI